jgi:hypothetical protein
VIEETILGNVKGSISIGLEHDIPLLLQVRNSKFVAHPQLFEFMQHAAQIPRRSFNWRLQRLLNQKYISACRVSGLGHLVYCITRQGLIELEHHGHFASVLNSRTSHLTYLSQAYHALALNSIQLGLIRRNLLVSWQSDVETASDNTISRDPLSKDYDAIVDVWNNDTAARFGLEYENTLKSAQQYERIRRMLEDESALSCILYLTAGEQITVHLANEFAGVPKRLAFATRVKFEEHALDTMVMTHPANPQVPFRQLLGGVF